jgi:hypothetical protein
MKSIRIILSNKNWSEFYDYVQTKVGNVVSKSDLNRASEEFGGIFNVEFDRGVVCYVIHFETEEDATAFVLRWGIH